MTPKTDSTTSAQWSGAVSAATSPTSQRTASSSSAARSAATANNDGSKSTPITSRAARRGQEGRVTGARRDVDDAIAGRNACAIDRGLRDRSEPLGHEWVRTHTPCRRAHAYPLLPRSDRIAQALTATVSKYSLGTRNRPVVDVLCSRASRNNSRSNATC